MIASNSTKEDFFVSTEGHKDVHNSGPDVLCVNDRNGKVLSSYSHVDREGLFRRQPGHEHLRKVLIKKKVLEPLVVKTDTGYKIGGHDFTEKEIKQALHVM